MNNMVKKWVKDLNRQLTDEDIQMANKHEKMLHIMCHQETVN